MAVDQYGVEAVVEGLNTFLQGISRINQGVASVGTQVQNTNGQLSVAGATFDKLISRWRDANGAFVSTATIAQRLQQSFAGVGAGAQAALAGLGLVSNGMMQLQSASSSADTELQKKPGDMSAVGGASQSLWSQLGNLGNAFLQTTGKIIMFAKAGLDAAISGIVRFGEAISNAIRRISSFWVEIGKIGLGVAFGNLLSKIGSEIRQLGFEVLQTTADFQLLEIRMRTISARDISKAKGIPITEAMAEASLQAQGLLEWVRQIAVTTPFPADKVAQSLALANAYGLQTEEAKVLTSSTLDFAAAMGLTSEHIYRIIYNLGQMKQQGKTTGREMRDLAISFFPIHDILREIAVEMGITTAEAEKLAQEGVIPVEHVMKKFADMVNRDFKGAAEAAAKTLTGLTDNFKDIIKTTLGLDVLGQLGKTVAGAFSDVLDAMRTNEFRENAKIIGGVLNASFINVARAVRDELLPALGSLLGAFGIAGTSAQKFTMTLAMIGFGIKAAITRLAQLVKGIMELFQNTLGRVQENGFTWGYNFISQFARGMAMAIKAIIQVIAAIARLIAGLFSPGSPPRVAPKIDEWGTSMIEEFAGGITAGASAVQSAITTSIAAAIAAGMQAVRDVAHGSILDISSSFSAASFKMFNDLAGITSSFLRSLSTGDDEGLIPRILGTRTAIAEAIAGVRAGLLSTADAFRKIASAMGNVPRGMAEFVRALIESEAAQTNLNAAQELGIETLARSAEILSRMTGSVKAAGQSYVDALNRMKKAQDANAIAEELLSNITEHYDDVLRGLRAQLEDVTEEYDEQQELKEIDAALSTGLLTTAEKERLEMKKRGIMLRAQIRDTEQRRDIEVEAAEDRVDSTKRELDLAEEEADKRERFLSDLAEAQADLAEEQLESARAFIELQIEQNELIKEQEELLDRLSKAGGGGAGMGGDLAGLEEALKGLDDLGKMLTPEEIQKKVDAIMAQAEKAFNEWADRMKLAIANAFGFDSFEEMVSSFKKDLIWPIQDAFTNFTDWMTGTAGPLFQQFFDIIGGSFKIFGEKLGELGTQLGLVIDPTDALTVILGVLLTLIAGPIVIALAILTGVIEAVRSGFEKASGVVEFFKDMFKDMRDAVDDAMFAFENAKEPLDKFTKGLEALGLIIVTTILAPFLAIAAIVSFVFALVLGIVEGFVTGFIGFFVDLYNQLIGESIIPDLMFGMRDIIFTVFGEIMAFFTEKLFELEELWRIAKENILEVATTKWQEIKTAITVPLNTTINTISERLTYIKGEWEKKWKEIRDFVTLMWHGPEGIVAKVTEGVTKFVTMIQVNLREAIDDAKGFLQSLIDKFNAVVDAIHRAIDAIADFIAKATSAAFNAARDAFGFVTGHSPSPLAVGIQTANDALRRFSNTIERFGPSIAAVRMAVQPRSASAGNVSNTNLTVNASYQNAQSPAGIYYDMTAALIAARM